MFLLIELWQLYQNSFSKATSFSASSPDESGNAPVLYYIGACVQKKRILLSKADQPKKWKEHMQPFP